MKPNLIAALKKELENSFGRKIVSSRDCLQMVEDIYQKTGYTINANTLRRFFGLVKTDYSASPSTLIILSKYCGFDSIDDFEKVSLKEYSDPYINKDEVLHYLISLFKNLDVNEGYSTLAVNMVHQTVNFLERNPSLIDKFQREMAKIPAGQHYYFEQSVNMDRLNDYYGDGLRYYLRANQNNNEAKAFAHSVLVFKYWLLESFSLVEKHMAELTSLPINQNFPPHILGRYIAARLYYANACNESVEKTLIDATKYHVAIMTRRSGAHPSQAYPHYELAVCEALILTNQFEESMEYIRRGKSFLADKGTTLNPFSIWERIIDSKRENKPLDVPLKKSATNFISHQLNKKYNNLVTLSQMPRVNMSQLSSLIAETGYTRFRKFMKADK
jgi:hypothetical protein